MSRHSPGDSWTDHEDRLFDLAVKQESSGTAEPTDVASDSEPVPPTISGYRILRKLGDGGMGVVYAARQDDPCRDVALKVLRGGRFADNHQIRLFERETRTLARLKHPGIATLYETGRTDEGEQFFAMELVEGIPPTEYARIHQHTARARLELFRQICEAVKHAHQRGVIHRDLKPSNILVDAHGNPKVLDFGLAKITESDVAKTTMVTEVGKIQGTLPYMSPEQARGNPNEIDLRSDIYSLGVLLYELLTEQLPYDTNRTLLHEAVRVICEEPPRKMSTINRALRGDLETIALKALEKDPDRRYQSAGALSDDLRRYLASEPILARPPSTWYKLRKFSRRNQAVVVGVATAFVLLIGGIAGTSWQAVRATRQRDRALQVEKELQQVVAFQASQLGEINPEQMGIRLREDLLRELRSAMSSELPDEDETASSMERLEELFSRANFTNVALHTLDRNIFERALAAVAEQFGDQPLVKARLLQTLAETLTDLGLFERALSPQSEALEIRRRLLRNEHPETLNSVANMCKLLWSKGDWDDAELYCREVLAARRRVLGEEHPSTLRSMNDLGVFLRTQGELDQAETFLREALNARRRILGEEHVETLKSLFDNASLRADQGKLDEAETMYRQVLEARRRVLGDEHKDTLGALNDLATVVCFRGNLAEAERYFSEALSIFRRKLGDDHPKTMTILGNLGYVLSEQGKLAEAETYFREAMNTRLRVLGSEHPATLLSMNNMGTLLYSQGKYDEALEIFRRTLAVHRRVMGNEHAITLTLIGNLGAILKAQGKLKEAEPYYREALTTRRRVFGNEHFKTLISISNMGALLDDQGKLDEAERYYREALDTRRRVLGKEHAGTLNSMNNMGSLLEAKGKLSEAEAYYREVLDTRRRVLGNEHAKTLNSISNMGFLLELQGRLEEAEPYHREALVGRRRVLGEEHPDTVISIANMGSFLRKQGRLTNAEEFLSEALEYRRSVLGADHPDTLSSVNAMGAWLQSKGELGEAELHYREALEGRRRVLGNEHPDTLSSINILGSLLIAQEHFEESTLLMRESVATGNQVYVDGHWSLAEAHNLLGESLTGLGRFSEAEPLLLEGYAGLDSLLPPRRRPETLPPSVERLVRLYEAWHAVEPQRGYDAKAATWRAKLGD